MKIFRCFMSKVCFEVSLITSNIEYRSIVLSLFHLSLPHAFPSLYSETLSHREKVAQHHQHYFCHIRDRGDGRHRGADHRAVCVQRL